MKDCDSVYMVFSGLPEFIKKNRILVKEHSTCEGFNFSEEMKGVRKIPNDTQRIKKTVAQCRLRVERTDERAELEKSLQDHHAFDVMNMPEYMEGYVEDIHPVILEKLRNGEFAIEKTLDLHGWAPDEAERIFSGFLQEAIKSGLRCIKVIHGRGLKSKGDPVIKEKLKIWVIKAMNRKWVIAFSSAKMCDGGPGATHILLRHKPKKERIHIIG